jgi:hypothetical protein
VDIGWKDGQLVHAGIKSDYGGEYLIRYRGKTRQFNIRKGETIYFDGDLNPIS